MSVGDMDYLTVDWHNPDTTVFPIKTINPTTVYDLSQPAGLVGGYYKLATNYTYGFTFDFEHNFDPRYGVEIGTLKCHNLSFRINTMETNSYIMSE